MTNKTIFPTGIPIVDLPAGCLTQLLSGARKTEIHGHQCHHEPKL